MENDIQTLLDSISDPIEQKAAAPAAPVVEDLLAKNLQANKSATLVAPIQAGPAGLAAGPACNEKAAAIAAPIPCGAFTNAQEAAPIDAGQLANVDERQEIKGAALNGNDETVQISNNSNGFPVIQVDNGEGENNTQVQSETAHLRHQVQLALSHGEATKAARLLVNGILNRGESNSTDSRPASLRDRERDLTNGHVTSRVTQINKLLPRHHIIMRMQLKNFSLQQISEATGLTAGALRVITNSEVYVEEFNRLNNLANDKVVKSVSEIRQKIVELSGKSISEIEEMLYERKELTKKKADLCFNVLKFAGLEPKGYQESNEQSYEDAAKAAWQRRKQLQLIQINGDNIHVHTNSTNEDESNVA